MRSRRAARPPRGHARRRGGRGRVLRGFAESQSPKIAASGVRTSGNRGSESNGSAKTKEFWKKPRSLGDLYGSSHQSTGGLSVKRSLPIRNVPRSAASMSSWRPVVLWMLTKGRFSNSLATAVRSPTSLPASLRIPVSPSVKSVSPLPISDPDLPIAMRPAVEFPPARGSIFDDPGDEKSWHASQRSESLSRYYEGREPSWYASAITPLKGADRVLDLGCGPGLDAGGAARPGVFERSRS